LTLQKTNFTKTKENGGLQEFKAFFSFWAGNFIFGGKFWQRLLFWTGLYSGRGILRWEFMAIMRWR
jgi:hypothetical protein